MIRSIGVISKPRKDELEPLVPSLLDWLAKREIMVYVDHETEKSLGSLKRFTLAALALDRDDLAAKVDLMLVLGGDGTLLAAARAAHGRDIPLLAVNLGKLGFLTAITIDEVYSTLELVLEGKHQIERRKMLQVDVIRNASIVATYHALNDAVINKSAIARILDFRASVDGQYLSFFKADGLIVSTPTGSTAYSLAAGGPIVYPSVDAFLITPICPHTLTHRPVVVPDRSKIEIAFESGAESVFLTVDGQVGLEFHGEDRVICSLSPNQTSLVRPQHMGFFEVLRNKLKWGER
jgi:NAD+ kinase